MVVLTYLRFTYSTWIVSLPSTKTRAAKLMLDHSCGPSSSIHSYWSIHSCYRCTYCSTSGSHSSSEYVRKYSAPIKLTTFLSLTINLDGEFRRWRGLVEVGLYCGLTYHNGHQSEYNSAYCSSFSDSHEICLGSWRSNPQTTWYSLYELDQLYWDVVSAPVNFPGTWTYACLQCATGERSQPDFQGTCWTQRVLCTLIGGKCCCLLRLRISMFSIDCLPCY